MCYSQCASLCFVFFFQAEDGIRDYKVTGVQTCALPISVTSDEAGLYNAPTLIPGTYTVRVEFPGFKTLSRENVVVEVGSEIRVELTIEPGQQSETVTVSEAIPLIDTTGATLGGVLANAAIND